MKTRNAELRQLLAEGPSTAVELALETRRTKRDVNVGLWVLQRIGHVVTVRTIPHPEYPGRGKAKLKLYELTTRGQAVVRMAEKHQ